MSYIKIFVIGAVFNKGDAMEEIIRFQKYMLLIRRTVGWSAEELGEKIGVTRQTINNLEKNDRSKYKLNKTQYIAIRSVLDAEIAKYPEETEVIKLMLEMLIDNPDGYDSKEIKTLLDKVNMSSPSILAGTATRKAVSKEVMIAMGTVLGLTVAPIATPIVAGGVISTWLLKAISSGKETKR